MKTKDFTEERDSYKLRVTLVILLFLGVFSKMSSVLEGGIIVTIFITILSLVSTYLIVVSYWNITKWIKYTINTQPNED